jgi:small-conductance mechanosensitive channel
MYTLLALASIYGVKAVFLRFLHKRINDVTTFYRTKRAVNAIAFFLLIIILATIWLQAGGSMVTYLGLISAGLALALKDILVNLAGWLYILLRQPFVVGDRIEIDGVKGDVIDQNLFKFRVIEIGNWVDAEQSTGRIVHTLTPKSSQIHWPTTLWGLRISGRKSGSG